MSPGGADSRTAAAARTRKFWLLVLFIGLWIISCIHPPYPDELVLQHIPTVIAVVLLVAVEIVQPLSLASYMAVLAFLCLHLLGARDISIRMCRTTHGSIRCTGAMRSLSSSGGGTTMTAWSTSFMDCSWPASLASFCGRPR